MKKILSVTFLLGILCSGKIFSQSMNCATATPITLTSGTACVNGTNVGAITDNTLYGGCNATPVDVVWYTYTAIGSNNTFTVTPGTLTNAEIVIYTGNCPTGAGAQLQHCATASGSSVLNTNWGMNAGDQVWLGIASTSLNDGTFQLCVNSSAPAPGAGNTCSQAIPICTLPFSHTTMNANSSGQTPTCFGSAPQRDIWVQFTVTKSGVLAWTATPVASTEFDWCLWDISSGCPGTVACCNYNYAGGSTSGFGMQNSGGNVACGYNSITGLPAAEFSPTMNVTCGKTYAIQISNYDNTNKGFTLAFTNSTCQINSTASFTATPALVCGASLTAAITDASTGNCAAVWDYGDGSANYNGANPPNHTYNTPGTYAITETIGGVCPATAVHYVQLLAPLAVTATSTSVNCSGQCTGTASVSSVTGGDGIYTYSWSPGGNTTNNISSLCPGTYSVTVSNAKCGTTITKTVSIVAPPALTLTPTPTNPSCGASNGSISLAGSGGTPTYSYNINGGAYSTTTNYTGLAAGTYTMGIKDSKGCTITVPVTLTNGPPPVVTVNSATICSGNSTVLTASGATTYSWSPATGLSATTGANPTASPTTTTTYTVVGTTTSCTASATSVITVNPLPTVTVASATICPGASTTLSASGASTYTWAPAGSLSSSTGSTVTASPGSTTVYTITGTSAASCTLTTTATVTIGAGITPTVPSATICSGTSTTLTASGGTTYTWSPATGLSATTGASVTANPASTTTYTINAASGACTGTTTAVVTVNPLPTVTVNSPSICIGASTTLNAAGATTYSWSPATGLSATTGASVTANPTVTTTYTVVGTTSTCTAQATSVVTVNPLPAVTSTSAAICPGGTGTLTASGASTYTWNTGATTATITDNPAATTNYTVTGTNANGCVNTATTTINVLNGLTITPPSATICAGATATLTASGATTYTWSPATGLSSTTGASVAANPTISTTYTITGASGTCSATATATLIVNSLPPVTATSGTICVGQQTANLTAGGASSYSWTPSTGLSSTSTANTVANPGTTTNYTVTGTDGNGCVNTATTAVTVNPLPTITVNSATICPTFSATLTAGGASTYSWNTGATGASLTASPATTTSYTVVGTDANGCFASNTATITVNPTLLVSAGNNTPICEGGTINLTSSIGAVWSWTGPGGYTSTSQNPSITNATAAMSGTYSVTATDANGCQGSATTSVTVNATPTVTATSGTICVGQQTANLTAGGASSYSWTPSTGLSSTNTANTVASPGTTTNYTVTGTDGNGCVNTATTAVTVNPLPTITVNSATICPTFSATLTASGALNYAWNTGATGASLTDSPASTTSYTVVGTDVNGCFAGNTATITVNPTLLVSAGNNTPICEGGTINLTSSIGAVWSWTGPGGYTSTSQNPSITNATAAMSGTYSVTATDANGCQGSATTNVTVNPLPIPTIGSNGPVCVNQTLNLNSGGGSSYSWSGPGSFTSAQQNPSITGVTSTANGVYTVTVTGMGNCVSTATLNVVVNSLPVVTVSGATVCANATINLNANAVGGTAYSWSGPAGFISNLQNPTISSATSANAGSYVVTVTDGNNCVNANLATVVVNPLPNVSATSGQICAGQTTAITGSGASTYNWSPPTGLSSSSSSAPVASPATTTVYTVTGTDPSGCQNTATATVVVTPGPPAVITPSLTSGCSPVCTSFTNTDTTNASHCTYNWTFGNGQTSNSVIPSTCYTVSGNYTVSLTVTNSAGCTGVSTATVIVYPSPHADFSASPQPTTILDNNIHFYDQTSGGANITTWNWNLGNGTTSTAQNPTCLYGDTGTFAVHMVVISNNGCKDSTTRYIRINDEFSLYVPNAFSPNGDDVNDIFYAKGEGVRDFKMWIFDRWGNLAFFSDDIYKGWDGRVQSKGNEVVQEDVYVWKIQCKTPKGERKQLSGHVSLIK